MGSKLPVEAALKVPPGDRLPAAVVMLRDPVFLVSAALYALNRWVIVPLVPAAPEFFRNHFNDVLLIPAALPVILAIYIALGLRSIAQPPTWLEVLTHLALWSLICEWLGPAWVGMGTGDVLDVLAYCAGALVAGAIWHQRWAAGFRERSQAYT